MHTSGCVWAVPCEPLGERAISNSYANLLIGLLASSLHPLHSNVHQAITVAFENTELFIFLPCSKSYNSLTPLLAPLSKDKVSTWLIIACTIWSLRLTLPYDFRPAPLSHSDSSHPDLSEPQENQGLSALGLWYKLFPLPETLSPPCSLLVCRVSLTQLLCHSLNVTSLDCLA